MASLTYFTKGLENYSPLSYAVVFFVFFFLSLILTGIAGWIWTHISYRIGTKKATFIKFKVENFRLNVIEKSNIYKVPFITGVDATILTGVPNPTPQNRKQKRAQAAQPTAPLSTSAQLVPQSRQVDASIIVQFEKPILSSMMLIKIEHNGGKNPTLNSNSIDERWASFHLSNMGEGSSFTVHFN